MGGRKAIRENMIHTDTSGPAHTSVPASLYSPGGIPPSPSPSEGRKVAEKKGNVNFSLLIGLTGSASLPAAQILEHVSYAQQHLQKTCCPSSAAGKQRENIPESGCSWQKAAEPRACKIKFVCFVCRSHMEPSETHSGVWRDRMKPKAKTGN